ncbi:hypothetical protein BD414DRAFT_510570 [Trametes punicea]|nr:hypothetical protein BD414DRAFT_510570 [Trametes punicea]
MSAAQARRFSSLVLLFCIVLSLVVVPLARASQSPSDCDPGEYYDSSRKSCSDCPAGTFTGVSGATSCCTCCAGFYQDGSGKSSCKKCPTSKPYSVAGATSVSQCRSGSGAMDSCTQTSKNTCPIAGGGNPSPRPDRRRAGAARRGDAACPFGWRSCPVWNGKGGVEARECVDVRRDLESCGGCVHNDSPFGERTAGGGRDCSAIPNVDDVRCVRGECVIGKCAYGYQLTAEVDRCVPRVGEWDPSLFIGLDK